MFTFTIVCDINVIFSIFFVGNVQMRITSFHFDIEQEGRIHSNWEKVSCKTQTIYSPGVQKDMVNRWKKSHSEDFITQFYWKPEYQIKIQTSRWKN